MSRPRPARTAPANDKGLIWSFILVGADQADDTQEASKGEQASRRVLQISRQLIEECRAKKDLDERSIAVRASACDPSASAVKCRTRVMRRTLMLGMGALQAHLLRIVDPVTKQPLTLERLEDEASVMFVAGATS